LTSHEAAEMSTVMVEPAQTNPITQYERAICYYALPRMVSPVTLGLLVAYALCVAEALAALAYGIYAGNEPWARAGLFAFAALVIFGVVVFTGRALLNEVRERRLLAAARGVPDAKAGVLQGADPFAGHVLLRHPLHHEKRHFDCESGDNTTRYHVEQTIARDAWEVTSGDGEAVCTVRVDKWAPSFALTQGNPWRMTVYVQGEAVAEIRHRYSLGPPRVELRMLQKPDTACQVRGDVVFQGPTPVGRLYRLRGNLYLDVRREALNPVILGYFATLT
jgi:hypothetical protein